ncbi:OmpH family outer membrane protein [Caldalkalibacillus mannanilyticus]|uniref:OmpH family outer membrane protein n=1 Tax=Caldalkalibacillus mannanilyticus TaxID=1418 RepID=UPI00046A79D0|nr:OmpH family outer membrane protein [Caldalkalibacillus mannanilyticus]
MLYTLIISFLLHLVTLLAIFILYQRRGLERLNLPSMKDDVETIHESIQAFVEELEKENEALYEKLVQHMKMKEQQWEERIREIEQRLSDTQEQLSQEREKREAETHMNPSATSTMNAEEFTFPLADSPPSETDSSPIPAPEISVMEPEKLEQESVEPEASTGHYQKALELYRQGFSPEQISKVLKIGKGETILLINMIKKKSQHHVE